MVTFFFGKSKSCLELLTCKLRGGTVYVLKHVLSFCFDPLWWLMYYKLRLKVLNLHFQHFELSRKFAVAVRNRDDLQRQCDDLRVFNLARRDVGDNTADGVDHGSAVSISGSRTLTITGRAG